MTIICRPQGKLCVPGRKTKGVDQERMIKCRLRKVPKVSVVDI